MFGADALGKIGERSNNIVSHVHFSFLRFGAAARACFTSWRTASGRDISSSCFDIHASNASNSSGGKRVLTGVASTRGRPLPLFLALDIDFTII
jgi:hypothetical protein